MKIEKLNFSNIPQLSPFDKAFQSGDPVLRPFFEHECNLEQFVEVIAKKNFPKENRVILGNALKKQYEGIVSDTAVTDNISSLFSIDTFTITTAHQPSLFTGPLYFIYKICSVINLCIQLKEKYSDKHFVPVYYMGSEDHDFEEINHLYIFGKRIEWYDKQGGAVGHYQTDSLNKAIEELSGILGSSPEALHLKTLLSESFKPGLNYGTCMFHFIHKLFERFGLLVLLPDAPELKRLMIPVFQDDLLHSGSLTHVNNTVSKLETLGFANQAFVRPINLFYLLPGKRERIEKQGDIYKVLNTEIQFQETEILSELENHPERFSPNVILRPLYQEIILPNLAYIGGGGELAYWMERKLQFENYGIPYPMLIRRNSMQWIDKNAAAKLEKLGFKAVDIFKETEALLKEFVAKNSGTDLSFNEERIAFEGIFNQISDKVKLIDASLEGNVAAQQAQLFNSLEKLETRLLRSEKQKAETELNQIRKIQEKLCLPNGLQERKENFMGLYLKYGEGLLDFLVEKLNPLEKEFLLVFE